MSATPRLPPSLEDRIVDLGYLAPAEVPDAFAAADAFLQPSANESFSRTIMEAWLAETVVIANRQSDVVTWHCERSGGGLRLRRRARARPVPAVCRRGARRRPHELARKGRDYVLANYRWPSVLDAMERSLEAFL